MIEGYLIDVISQINFLCSVFSVIFGAICLLRTVYKLLENPEGSKFINVPRFVYVCLIICLLGTIFIPKDLKYNYIQDREQKIQKLQKENFELNLTIRKYNLEKELQELRKQDVHN